MPWPPSRCPLPPARARHPRLGHDPGHEPVRLCGGHVVRRRGNDDLSRRPGPGRLGRGRPRQGPLRRPRDRRHRVILQLLALARLPGREMPEVVVTRPREGPLSRRRGTETALSGTQGFREDQGVPFSPLREVPLVTAGRCLPDSGRHWEGTAPRQADVGRSLVGADPPRPDSGRTLVGAVPAALSHDPDESDLADLADRGCHLGPDRIPHAHRRVGRSAP